MTGKRWEDYGDVNPIEHGGMYVQHDRNRCYYAIQVSPIYDYENDSEAWLIIDAYVDLDDDWIEWESVLSTMDTPRNADDSYLVTDVVHYYGNHASNGEELIIKDREELIQWLKVRGIEVE